jgi:hypothetical protein
MIESGKRVPSEDVLEVLSSLFQREPRWFLDDNPEIETPLVRSSARRRLGGCAA